MGRQMNLSVNGQQVEVTAHDFSIEKEAWNEFYVPELGVTVRARLIVKRIFTVDGKKTPDGLPMILIDSDNVVVAEPVPVVEREARIR